MTNVKHIVNLRSSEKNEAVGEAFVAAIIASKNSKFPYRVTIVLDFDNQGTKAQEAAERYILQVMRLRKRYSWEVLGSDRTFYLDADANFSVEYGFRNEEQAMIFKLAMAGQPGVLEVKYTFLS